MKYENFDGPVEKLVLMKIKEIEEKLTYYKALVEGMKDDRKPDWEPLEEVFRNLVK